MLKFRVSVLSVYMRHQAADAGARAVTVVTVERRSEGEERSGGLLSGKLWLLRSHDVMLLRQSSGDFKPAETLTKKHVLDALFINLISMSAILDTV